MLLAPAVFLRLPIPSSESSRNVSNLQSFHQLLSCFGVNGTVLDGSSETNHAPGRRKSCAFWPAGAQDLEVLCNAQTPNLICGKPVGLAANWNFDDSN